MSFTLLDLAISVLIFCAQAGFNWQERQEKKTLRRRDRRAQKKAREVAQEIVVLGYCIRVNLYRQLHVPSLLSHQPAAFVILSQFFRLRGHEPSQRLSPSEAC